LLWAELQQQDLRLNVQLSAPNYCFSSQVQLNGQQQLRTVRLHFYADNVEALYSVRFLPDGPEHQFRLLGSRQGNEIEVFGTVYYDQESVELHSHMQLQAQHLLFNFDGQTQLLPQIACKD